MMNDASTPNTRPAAMSPPGKLAYATPTTAPLVAGRRSFFKYRDLGVTAASSGKIRAQVTIGADGMTQPTGWHYHVCEGQFVYMLSGWVDLEFEDGQRLRIQAGESLYIPGGLRHNETGASKDLELLEVSVPADMGTVALRSARGLVRAHAEARAPLREGSSPRSYPSVARAAAGGSAILISLLLLEDSDVVHGLSLGVRALGRDGLIFPSSETTRVRT